MTGPTELTTVEAVREDGSWLFTVTDAYGADEEVILVPCDDPAGDPVEAGVNRCTHESQRLDRGSGVAMRDGEIVCPKHGSAFDACSGHCDNGEAADTTLPSVDVETADGTVYLVDDGYAFAHAGAADDDRDDDGDEGPSSTSHLGF